MGDLVHIRLDKKIRTEIHKIVEENMFSNESEFIRDAIRTQLELYNKIKILNSLRGSVKSTKNHKRIPPSEVFRAVGLEE